MKNIKILFASALLVFGFHSCNYTDLNPTDIVDESLAFRDVAGIQKGVTGAYGKMSLRRTIQIAEYIADDATQAGDAGGAGTDLTGWVYAASNGDARSFWLNTYSLINQCNRVLYYGLQLPTSNATEAAELENALGELYFMRAYAHFDLLRLYADFNVETKLGIPYVSHYHVLGTPGRDTVEETYDQIMYDLERAYSMIAAETPTDKAYASKVAVNAMRARVSLYRKNWSHAFAYAQDVLNQMNMAEMDEMDGLWKDQNRAGVILLFPRFAGDLRIGGLFIGADYSSVFAPSTAYMNSYPSNDVRTGIYYGDGRDRAGNFAYVVYKWYGGTVNIGLADEKALRVEEMKLIEAEALAELGRYEDAVSSLDDLRFKRISGYTSKNYASDYGSDPARLFSDILLERRRELSFEGHRFFDLRRRGLDLTKDGKTMEEYLKLLPIPRDEINANPVIAEQQNPGY